SVTKTRPGSTARHQGTGSFRICPAGPSLPHAPTESAGKQAACAKEPGAGPVISPSAHSNRSASMGSRRAAFQAGKKPKATPTSALNTNEPAIHTPEIATGQ